MDHVGSNRPGGAAWEREGCGVGTVEYSCSQSCAQGSMRRRIRLLQDRNNAAASLLGRCARFQTRNRCQIRNRKDSLPEVINMLGGATPFRWGIGQCSAPHPNSEDKLSDENSMQASTGRGTSGSSPITCCTVRRHYPSAGNGDTDLLHGSRMAAASSNPAGRRQQADGPTALPGLKSIISGIMLQGGYQRWRPDPRGRC